jgi:CBS domain containing-hemolysin-like protein
MTLLVVYALAALGISFLCSLLEACLLSLPRSFVESVVERGSPFGPLLRDMKQNIDRPLAAILTLNTVAHTAGAIGVGAQAAVVFGSGSVGVASAVMTILVLVASEIIPKTLGAVHARRIAIPAAVTIRALIYICLPLIIPLEWVSRAVGSEPKVDEMSRAELLATIRLGKVSGAMGKREYEVATNLIALARIRISEVMTPRTVVFALPAGLTVAEALAKHHPIRFARIPIYDEDRDRPTRYVPRFELHSLDPERAATTPLADLARPMLILPESGTVADALDGMIHRAGHIALVVDEYGAMAGIVTLEDLLETLLGEEIVDETDTVADMQALARQGAELRRS